MGAGTELMYFGRTVYAPSSPFVCFEAESYSLTEASLELTT